MRTTSLHLVGRRGEDVSAEIREAVHASHRWAIRDYPRIDSALLANWAEDVARSMQEKSEAINTPRRYAFAAMRGKVLEWIRRGGTAEFSVGIGAELETWIGVNHQKARSIERAVLFEQLKTRLNDRDRCILLLLQQDVTSPTAVAAALGVNYNAAAKAIQRVKEKIKAMLLGEAVHSQGKTTQRLCKIEG